MSNLNFYYILLDRLVFERDTLLLQGNALAREFAQEQIV